jgi:uncharacterized protein (TIGR00255 family)
MTGFATKNIVLSPATGENIQITISIKSLNSRFFETTFKMPHIVGGLEVPLIKHLKRKLLRGHVYFTLYINNTAPFKGEVEPALSVFKGYADAIEKIKQHIPLTGSLSVSDIVQLPHAFTVQEKELDQATSDAFLKATDEFITQVIEEQKKEGQLLAQDLKDRFALVRKEMSVIEERSHAHIAEYKEKIAQEIKLIDQADASADARKSALYITLDKIDIHEEIVRFKSHLDNMETLITSIDIEKGKRMDFILQELSREINTISAKASDATICGAAVNIKVELEKAREQAQNIV